VKGVHPGRRRDGEQNREWKPHRSSSCRDHGVRSLRHRLNGCGSDQGAAARSG
jgi:hypothetical protein